MNIVFKYLADVTDLKSAGKVLDDQTKKEEELLQKVYKVNHAAKQQGKDFEDAGKRASKATKDANNEIGNLNNILRNGAKMVAAYFTVDAAQQFIGKVVSVTAEFQRLQTVLANTLGSDSAGTMAFAMIQDFATSSVYSVQELTEGFVKLASRGITPTREMLRQMGDIAASQGKSFDQLTEAMLDAMTGEFERLKEFGIRASSQGDQVAFTFKGVTTTVKKTDDAIRDYITSLGNLEGVSGANEKIAGTLGGKLSNLGDAFSSLFFTIGEGSSGPMSGFIDLMTQTISAVAEFGRNEGDQKALEVAKAFEKMRESLEGLSPEQATERLNELTAANIELKAEFEDLGRKQVEYSRKADEMGASTKAFLGIGDDYAHKLELIKFRLEGTRVEYLANREAIDFLNKKMSGNNAPVEEAGKLETLRKQLKALREEREKAMTDSEIATYNQRIVFKEKEIKDAEKLGLIEQDNLDVASMRAFTWVEILTHSIEEQKARAEEFKDFISGQKLELMDESNEWTETEREASIRRLNTWVKEHEDKIAIVTTFRDTIAGLYNTILENQIQSGYERLAALQEQQEQELAITGDNTRARQELEQQHAEERKRIEREIAEDKRKQAILAKALAVTSITVDTAKGVIAAMADSPLTFGLPWSAVIAATGAAQAATVLAQKIPKYAKGVEKVPGIGSDTSDNIPALLSPNERVVDAKTNRKYFPILSAIHKGDIPAEFLNSLVDVPSFNIPIPAGANVVNHFDTSTIEAGLGRLERAIERQQLHQTVFDDAGIRHFVQTRNTRVEIRNRRHT